MASVQIVINGEIMSDFKTAAVLNTDNEVYISEYSGSGQKCVVPEIIEQNYVTGIDKFAFSEHRELQEIILPQTVRYIGAHAFYNCRALTKIILGDKIIDIGDGAFKNCYNICCIDMYRTVKNSKCLKGILSEVNNEVMVNLHYDDGQAQLIFPYYLYNYEENTPARIINQVTQGSGIRYRECITGEDINYAEYDRIFSEAMHIDVQDSAWKIACCRLRYPYKLSENAAQCYRTYLRDNRLELIKQMIEKEDYDSLKALLAMELADNEDLKICIDWARENSHMEGLGILLAHQKEKYGTVKKTFEF